MKKPHSSIDGFIPRRAGNKLGEAHRRDVHDSIFGIPVGKSVHKNSPDNMMHSSGKRQAGLDIVRSDIDESLREIDSLKAPEKKLSRRQRRRMAKMSKKPTKRLRKFIKWFFIILFILIIGFGAYAGYKFIAAGGNIFQGSIFDIFQSQPLKEDENGRSNFLILGTSEDDPGHPGANLTDSMLVVSLDQKNKNIYMFSVPRDLYVEYGEACVPGYAGKINAYFSCVSDEDTAEAEQLRLTKTQKLVGDIFGLDIQYGVHVNHAVIKESVDAIGGVDVEIEGSGGAPGILDRNFDWRCNYDCYFVKYDNGIHHLDGEHALFLSMARGDDSGFSTYGLGNSNFDREKNQQKILIAIKDKAISTGTLTDIGKVTRLIDSFGNNLRTNIQQKEIRTLIQFIGEVKSNDINTIALFDDGVMKADGNPSAGIYNYSEIQLFIKKSLTSDPVVREAAPIAVFNGTNQLGYGQTQADLLTDDGYNVVLVDNAPDRIYEKVEIYQIGTDGEATATKLADKYKITIKKTKPPVIVNGNIQFVIIFGTTTS